MIARAQPDVGDIGFGPPGVPLVDDQVAIDPDAHAVVGVGLKAIGSRVEIGRTAPAHREVVNRDIGSGRTRAPVEVDAAVLAHQRGEAGQEAVGEVFAQPAAARRHKGGESCRRPRGRRDGSRRRRDDGSRTAEIGKVARYPAQLQVRGLHVQPLPRIVLAQHQQQRAVCQRAHDAEICAGAVAHIERGAGDACRARRLHCRRRWNGSRRTRGWNRGGCYGCRRGRQRGGRQRGGRQRGGCRRRRRGCSRRHQRKGERSRRIAHLVQRIGGHAHICRPLPENIQRGNKFGYKPPSLIGGGHDHGALQGHAVHHSLKIDIDHFIRLPACPGDGDGGA